MSGAMNPSDPWRPVHHADAWTPKLVSDNTKPAKAKPKPADTAPETGPQAKQDGEPKPGRTSAAITVSTPLDVTMALPDGLADDIITLVEAQRDLADQVATLVDKLNKWTADVQSAMQAAQQPVIETMQSTLQQVMAGQQALAAQVKQLADAQPALTSGIASWSHSIEAAIRAPRRVALERGQDGLATGAVSSVVSTPTQPPEARTSP
jgi:ABC-type transporter Mla subunit MlaD